MPQTFEAGCRSGTPNCQVTEAVHPDNTSSMAFLTFRMHVLILAAYVLAAILPVLALGEGRQQSQADHAQMMAMAGHLGHMPATDGPNDLTQQLLCQQHCLFAAASLPVADRAEQMGVRSSDVAVGVGTLAASLAIPPPGPPPKIAVI